MIYKTIEEVEFTLKFIEKMRDEEMHLIDNEFYKGRNTAFDFVLSLFNEEFTDQEDYVKSAR